MAQKHYRQTTLHNIQILRAIAAIMVVLHHTFPHYEAMGGTSFLLKHISEWGFMGVDIFFVISGFIMAFTTFNKPRDLKSSKTFLKHRLTRIYLGYWPFFLAMLIILIVTNAEPFKKLDILGSFLLINSNMFQLVLPVSWSLSYELYFYILFLLTFLFSVKQLYLYIPLFIGVLLLIVLYTFFNPQFPKSFFYSPFLLEFFAGVLLYMYKDTFSRFWFLPIYLVIIGVTYTYGINYETKNGFFRILTFGTGALFVVALALLLEQNKYYSRVKIIEDIGNASYTLYLSHLIILHLFYLSGLRNFFTYHLLPNFGFIIIMLLCILFSLVYYKTIERPIYKKVIDSMKT